MKYSNVIIYVFKKAPFFCNLGNDLFENIDKPT